MLERAKSRKFLVAVVALLLLTVFVINKVDADSDPPFIVLWGESDIKAITYHSESGLYCFETPNGIDCECKCILEGTCEVGVTESESVDEATEKSTPEAIQTSTPSSTTPTPTHQPIEPTTTPHPSDDGQGNNGHGNDQDHCDSSNPGNSCHDGTDDDGFPPGHQECGGPPGQCQ